MRRNFGKILVLAVVAGVVALTAGLAAAAPPDQPPGLARAIEAQEAHTDALLARRAWWARRLASMTAGSQWS